MRKNRKLLGIFLSMMVMMLLGCGTDTFVQINNETSPHKERNGEKEEILVATDSTESEEAEQVDKLEFPVILEDGKLEIENVFWFDGINPDCNNEEGSNIASITVRNVSDTYLERANIAIATNSGEELRFAIENLPAERAMLAFSIDNTSIDTEIICEDVFCEAIFNSDEDKESEKIKVSTDGTTVTLQNSTDKEIRNIVVDCHSILEDEFFGGRSYSYNVDSLPPSGTTEFDAVDCFLGYAEVVCVVVKE